jgi:hypothetical protein
MNKFPKIPEVVEEPEEEEEEIEVPKQKLHMNEIFKMDEDESSSDEEPEIPKPAIPIKKEAPAKKERSAKQLAHLERIRVKAAETRRQKTLLKSVEKKTKEEEKKKQREEKQAERDMKRTEITERANKILNHAPEPRFSLNDIETIVSRSVDNALLKHTNQRKAELEVKQKEVQKEIDTKQLLNGLLKKSKTKYY